MNKYEKDMIDMLEAMPLEQARRDIAKGLFGAVGSPNYDIVSAWLSVKETELREAGNAEMLSINRKALRTSYWAIVIAIAAIMISTATAIIITSIQAK